MRKVIITREGPDFLLKDNEGTIYGRYDVEDAAQEACDDWNAYYKSPLPAENES